VQYRKLVIPVAQARHNAALRFRFGAQSQLK
jgi:hypothetical protein